MLSGLSVKDLDVMLRCGYLIRTKEHIKNVNDIEAMDIGGRQ